MCFLNLIDAFCALLFNICLFWDCYTVMTVVPIFDYFTYYVCFVHPPFSTFDNACTKSGIWQLLYIYLMCFIIWFCHFIRDFAFWIFLGVQYFCDSTFFCIWDIPFPTHSVFKSLNLLSWLHKTSPVSERKVDEPGLQGYFKESLVFFLKRFTERYKGLVDKYSVWTLQIKHDGLDV